MTVTFLSIMLTIYCVAGLFVIRAAYCRLLLTSKRTRPAVRANYILAASGQIVAITALLLAGLGAVPKLDALAVGLAAVSASGAIGFALSSHRWRGGLPPGVDRDEAPAIFPWERPS